MTEDVGNMPYPPSFVDQRLFPRLPWLTARNTAYFLIIWFTAFFVGSLAVNNPFLNSPGATAALWAGVGSWYPSYYWVVMYLHGLNSGLMALAGLAAVALLELPSVHVRKGILIGALIAGILSPIGAVFNSVPPWNASAGLWVQVAAFLALDEIVILILWGMLELWRTGAERSRTMPFVTVGLCAGALLLAALLGHIAGTMVGFGDPSGIFSGYAAQIGVSFSDLETSVIENHAYLMISTVPVGMVTLLAIRFGYYGLTGWKKNLARTGFVLMCLALLFQVGLALIEGVGAFSNALPTWVSSFPFVPSFLGVDDGVNAVFMVLGCSVTLIAIAIGSRRVQGWGPPSGVPLRITPLVAFITFATVTALAEPTGGSVVGTPPEAWIRLFIAFWLCFALMMVILVAEGLVDTGQNSGQMMRIGWTALVGIVLVLIGATDYLQTGAYAGGYVAVAGVVLVGLSFLLTAGYGLKDSKARSPATGGSTPGSH